MAKSLVIAGSLIARVLSAGNDATASSSAASKSCVLTSVYERSETEVKLYDTLLMNTCSGVSHSNGTETSVKYMCDTSENPSKIIKRTWSDYNCAEDRSDGAKFEDEDYVSVLNGTFAATFQGFYVLDTEVNCVFDPQCAIEIEQFYPISAVAAPVPASDPANSADNKNEPAPPSCASDNQKYEYKEKHVYPNQACVMGESITVLKPENGVNQVTLIKYETSDCRSNIANKSLVISGQCNEIHEQYSQFINIHIKDSSQNPVANADGASANGAANGAAADPAAPASTSGDAAGAGAAASAGGAGAGAAAAEGQAKPAADPVVQKTPTNPPTNHPTHSPTKEPTPSPTAKPTEKPTNYPTEAPTEPLSPLQQNWKVISSSLSSLNRRNPSIWRSVFGPIMGLIVLVTLLTVCTMRNAQTLVRREIRTRVPGYTRLNQHSN